MAKIHEEIIIIKLSKLLKDQDSADAVVTDDIKQGLEAVAQELVGDSVIVEVFKE